VDEQGLVGVDVGGTHLRAGLVIGHAVVWEQRIAAGFSTRCRADAPRESLELVLSALAAAAGAVLQRHPRVGAVGLAIPGFLDPDSGLLVSSPNLPGVVDADLVTPLVARLGLPVVAENDALAAAWGELALHPQRPRSLIYLGLGTGVGGGVVLEGEPYRGRHGVAMEVGHLTMEPGGRPCGCGNLGCLERYASATGVMLSYEQATGERLEARAVAARAREGDPAARQAVHGAGQMLGAALAHLMKVLDVPDVVVGGGLSASWDLLAPGLEERLQQDLIPVLRGRARVRPSASADQAGMLGAALLAARHIGQPVAASL
jgi:glucokinase